MNVSSRIPLYLGCASLAILAVIHLISHFLLPLVALNKDQETLLALYRSVVFQMPLGQQRTLSEIMNGYSLYFPTLLLSVVTLLLISIRNTVALRPALQVTLVTLLVLIIVTYFYMVVPPLIIMCFSAICFGLALKGLA